MLENKRLNSEITLLALVVTIIILLIISTVAIATLGGENGLIKRTIQAKEAHKIAEAKEKIELEIANLQIEKQKKMEELTKDDLQQINNEEINVKDTTNFPVEVVYEKYKFEIDEKFKVNYIGEINETIVTYTTSPEGYTNKDEITVKMKISNTLGIKKIEYPDKKMETDCYGKKNITIDYNVNKNGVYLFKILDINDNETQKEIVIQQFDKNNPIINNISIENITTNELTIKVDAEDEDENDESVKSGIEKYEYYIKSNSDNEYTKYESKENQYIVSNLKPDTEYEIYVIVYDNAQNTVTTEIKKQQTKSAPKNIYIDANNGNDTTGDGTQNNPFKTLNNLNKIIVNGFTYNIYLNDGKYNFVDSLLSLDANKDISIIGKGKSTEIFASSKYSSIKKDYSLKFCKLIWNANFVSTNVICTYTSLEFHNVVFYNMSSNANDYFLPNDHGREYTYAIYTFDHCTLPTFSENTLSIYQGGKFNIKYCYGGFESGWATGEEDWLDKTYNCITKNPKVDSEYRITDPNCAKEYGVYYGEYAWK